MTRHFGLIVVALCAFATSDAMAAGIQPHRHGMEAHADPKAKAVETPHPSDVVLDLEYDRISRLKGPMRDLGPREISAMQTFVAQDYMRRVRKPVTSPGSQVRIVEAALFGKGGQERLALFGIVTPDEDLFATAKSSHVRGFFYPTSALEARVIGISPDPYSGALKSFPLRKVVRKNELTIFFENGEPIGSYERRFRDTEVMFRLDPLPEEG